MKKVLSFIFKIKLLLTFLKRVFFRKSEPNSKSKIKLASEILSRFIKDYHLFTTYFVFGLDKKDKKVSDYIGKKSFFNYLNKAENRITKKFGAPNNSFSILIKDKFYLASILTANGISHIQSIAFIHNSFFIFKEGDIKPFEKGLEDISFPIIIKNTIKEYNEGFNLCDYRDGNYIVNNLFLKIDEFKNRFRWGTWVVQPLIKSHSKIQEFNKSALNTTRIVTLINNGVPQFIGGFQAFAVGTAPTDSWGHGAVYVGIDPKNNCLTGNGYYHPNKYYAETAKVHPDSKIEFNGYEIPFLKEAVELCIKAHSYFPYTLLIGWDVAITDSGPFILEGNERPGMTAFQLINGGVNRYIRS